MDFELWPQFSDFARFLCAFALKCFQPQSLTFEPQVGFFDQLESCNVFSMDI